MEVVHPCWNKSRAVLEDRSILHVQVAQTYASSTIIAPASLSPSAHIHGHIRDHYDYLAKEDKDCAWFTDGPAQYVRTRQKQAATTAQFNSGVVLKDISEENPLNIQGLR